MLNPQDIRKHEFARAWRGYNREEVHALLDALAREFGELAERNRTQAAALKAAEEEVARYHREEKALQENTLAVHRALDEKRRDAELEAARLVGEGRRRAEEEETAARARMDALRAELTSLEQERERFFDLFRELLRGQAELLQRWSETGAPRPDPDPAD